MRSGGNPGRRRHALTFFTPLLVILTSWTAMADVPAPPSLDEHTELTREASVTLSGDAQGSVTVEINSPKGLYTVPVDAQERFAFELPLAENAINFVFVTGISVTGERSAPTPTEIRQDQQPPTLFIDLPTDGASVTTDTVDVVGRVGDLLSGYLGLTVTVNGQPAVVDIGIGTNGTFFAQDVQVLRPTRAGGPLPSPTDLQQGDTGLIIATAIDALGNERSRRVELTIVPIPEDQPIFERVSGDRQTGAVGSPLAEPIVVRVMDTDGQPFAGKILTFQVTRSDGRLSPDGIVPGERMIQARTDESGHASAFWTLGSDAGCGNNRVTVTSNGVFGDVVFCASANAGAPVAIEIGAGNNMRAEAFGPAPEPIEVWVHDGQNGVGGVPVVFTVIEGGGQVNGGAFATAVTDITGHAQVDLVLGNPGANRVEATFLDNPETPVTFYLHGVERDASQPTRVTGAVVDNAGQPLQGAGVRLVVGGQEMGTTTTDIDGRFVFDDVSAAGFGDLYFDGTTVFHVGGATGRDVPLGSFPPIHYTLVLIPNAESSLPSAVPLPPLDPDNVVIFDGSEDVLLGLAGVEGLTFTVSRDTIVTLPDGTIVKTGSGNQVALSLNQVHFDKLPMAMPDGIVPQYAGTFQPGGSTFDPPVQVEMPNFSGFAPGATVYFLAFDHETNRFEVNGTGQVTPDGQSMVSDPGSGYVKAGWHGPNNPNRPRGDVTGGTAEDDEESLDHPDEEPPTKDTPPAAPGDDRARSCAEIRGEETELIDPVYFFSGEFYLDAVDMVIPGRGMDFVWARKYRSKRGQDTAQGRGWDFSYNLSVSVQGNDRIVRDGHTRSDVYRARPDGTWANNGQFRELVQNGDGTYTLTFANGGQWRFAALDGAPAEGKVTEIVDRNGNRIAFAYDPSGRLQTITDTLDRVVTLAYDAAGFLASVTDFTGRQVLYSYYQNADLGGSLGDLRSVTSPVVIGTPHANDFPSGKTVTYTYTAGFADDRLNHNLLTITDAKGQTWLQNTYAPTQAPADLEFDRILRQVWGDPSDIVDLSYDVQVPDASNGGAVIRTIVNDRAGNVAELFFDALNRPVLERRFTGRANPDQKTTPTQNRPSGKLRASDPDFFETRWEWSSDFRATRITHPNGNVTARYFSRDLDPKVPRRSRGNLCLEIRLPGTHAPAGDPEVLTSLREFDPQYNFVTREVDARGNETRHVYDASGNRIQTIHPIPSIIDDFEYNAFGQLTAHVHPDHGSGMRRRDEWTYFTSGPQRGYLEREIVDAQGHALTTRYEVDALGRPTRIFDPKGQDRLVVYNALDQVVRRISRETSPGSGIRYETDLFYDANDNVVRVDLQNRDETGQLDSANPYFTTLSEYDVLNEVTRVCEEVGSFDVPRVPPQLDCSVLPASEFVTTLSEYDENRNRVRVTFGEAAEGRQPGNALAIQFDERDLPFRSTRGPGTADASTRQLDYDGNRNLVRTWLGIEATPQVLTRVYDGFDRLVATQDPQGNVRWHSYDANGNLVRDALTGELVDLPGSADNRLLAEVRYAFDPLNRLITETKDHFDPETGGLLGDGESTATFEYSNASLVVRIVNDNGHDVQKSYDSAHRLDTVTDAKGNQVVTTYDANSNVVQVTEVDQSDLGGPAETYVTVKGFDGLDRVVSTIDPAGNVTLTEYDSRHNPRRVVDARGNETRHAFDGLNRPLLTVRDLDGDGADPADAADILTRQVWDDSSRLTARIDDLGNTTTTVYDALNRWTSIQHADGTSLQTTYDAHDHRLTTTDANGTVVTSIHDGLDRMTRHTFQPGPGVATDTTVEMFVYDGLGRVVEMRDDDSLVTRRYDSLGNELDETQDGRTVESGYDGLGNRLGVRYPGGRTLTMTYDALERMQTLADGSGSIASWDFIGTDRVLGRTTANGVRTDITWNGIGNDPADFGVKRIARTSHVQDPSGSAIVVDERRYTYDPAFNKTGRFDLRSGGPMLETTTVLDAAHRAIRTTVRDAGATVLRDEQLVLDGAGNRQTVTGGLHPGSYTLDATAPVPADAQVHQYTQTPIDASRQYDASGSLTVIDSGLPSQRLLRYDVHHRLVEVQDAATGQRHVYRYDPLGRRTHRIVDVDGAAEETRYVYDGWTVIEERDAGETVLASFVHGQHPDDVVTMRRGSSDVTYHLDERLSVMAITAEDGSVLERYEYGDNGQPLDPSTLAPLAGSPSARGNPLLFTGRRFDPETGLYFFRARYLDPKIGRFLTRDPLGTWGDPLALGNGRSYAAGNPSTFSDPSGKIVPLLIAGAGKLATAIGVGEAIGFLGSQYYRGKRVAQISGRLEEINRLIGCYRHDPGILDALLRERRALIGEAAGTLSDVARDTAEQVLPGHPGSFNGGPTTLQAHRFHNQVQDMPEVLDLVRTAQRHFIKEEGKRADKAFHWAVNQYERHIEPRLPRIPNAPPLRIPRGPLMQALDRAWMDVNGPPAPSSSRTYSAPIPRGGSTLPAVAPSSGQLAPLTVPFGDDPTLDPLFLFELLFGDLSFL
ncbi:MAG: RHS repeat-associated core domain-containing protein [Planctomycetota bacterium]